MLNVVNSVIPNSITRAVKIIKENRDNKETKEAPIMITNEFA